MTRVKETTKKKTPVKQQKVKKDDDTAIEFRNVTKEYRLYPSENQRLLAYVIKHHNYKTNKANDNLSFKIKRGESVAIMGRNGAGKSTMLKMITGASIPHPGRGRCQWPRQRPSRTVCWVSTTSLLGRENIYLKGMLLGLDKPEIKSLENQIIRFADIGDYIDQQVRTYSSGMRARLGFAINAHIDPDILVVDEALSVWR